MKIRKIHIDRCKVFQNFDIDFTNNDGRAQSLIVIAGINGSGKTTLLRNFIYPAFHNKSMSKDSFIEVEYKEKGYNESQNYEIVTIDPDFFQGRFISNSSRQDVLLPKFKNIIILYFTKQESLIKQVQKKQLFNL